PMNPGPPIPDELRALAEAAIEGRLTAEQREQLERLVLASPDARRFYAEYVHQHAALQWAAANPAFLSAGTPPERSQRWPRRRLRRWGVAAAVLAAGVALAVGLLSNRGPEAVATIAETKGCKWDAGTLPTEVGAQLQPGRLRLAEGLARIVFAGG